MRFVSEREGDVGMSGFARDRKKSVFSNNEIVSTSIRYWYSIDENEPITLRIKKMKIREYLVYSLFSKILNFSQTNNQLVT